MLAGALVYRVFGIDAQRKREWDRQHLLAIQFLWLWILPMLLLGTLVGYTEAPGHVFTYLPGLLMVGAVIAAQLQRRWIRTGVVTLVVAVNVFAFTAWPQKWSGIFFGTERTAREIRQHDAQLESLVRAIRSRYAPAQAILCYAQGNLLLGLRHLQLCLPEFDHYEMNPDDAMVTPQDKPMLSVHLGRLEFVSGIELGSRRVALLIVPPGLTLNIFKPYFDTGAALEVENSGGTVYAVPIARIRRSSVLGH